ncbi:MAG: cytochrome C [bacterium]|nr:cytochrome C [bacterium]
MMKFKKKALFIFTVLSLLVLGNVYSEIRYTHHDFEYWNWVYPAGSNPRIEICVFCHTPHNAMTDAESSEAPLWNHAITSAGYAVYSSPTMDAITGAPTGLSKLCLSCHDGTIAVDSHSGRTGSVTLGPPGSGFGHEGGLIGTNLMDDHPISFVYNSSLSLTDVELNDPGVTPSGLPRGGTIDTDMLFNGRVECASCHDVHVRRSSAGPACWGCHVVDGQWYSPPKQTLSLRKSNEQSALCFTCHKK